nr:allo56 [Herpesvirus DDDp]
MTSNGNNACRRDQSSAAVAAAGATFFFTGQNFIKSIPFDGCRTFLYFFFDRGDIVSNVTADIGFRNMCRELRLLLRILCYIAHCNQGSEIYLIYLEPHLVEDLNLNPSLRCALTSDFCLLFSIPTRRNNVDGFVEEIRSMEEDVVSSALASFTDAVKRLICVDTNLISTTRAYVMRDDRAKTTEVLNMFDFSIWKYAQDAMDRKIKGLKSILEKPLPTSDTTLTWNSLAASIVYYFGGNVSAGGHLSFSVDELLEFLFTNLAQPESSPVWNRFRHAFDKSPYLDLIAAFSPTSVVGNDGNDSAVFDDAAVVATPGGCEGDADSHSILLFTDTVNGSCQSYAVAEAPSPASFFDSDATMVPTEDLVNAVAATVCPTLPMDSPGRSVEISAPASVPSPALSLPPPPPTPSPRPASQRSMLDFLDRLSSASSLSVSSQQRSQKSSDESRESLLMFAYNIEHLINKDNFNLFESVPFLRYPHLPTKHASVVPYMDAVMRGYLSSDSVHELVHLNGSEFGLVWPYLNTFRLIADEIESISVADMSALHKLKMKSDLFYNTVLKNANKIATEPAKSIFKKSLAMLDGAKGCRGLAAAAAVSGLVVDDGDWPRLLQNGDSSQLPKRGDYLFLKKVFCEIFGLGRNTQAVMSLVHILHTTAPKWKANKLMLVNYTRGGTGKSHTVNVLKDLFREVTGLFGNVSTFTDTVLKYSEMTVGRVIVMDDVGFSAAQQKSVKREDAMISGQFKSLLDTGYTNNQCTEKDPLTNAFRVRTRLMVSNSAFMWNTNTLDSFSDALQDRCVIIGAEPLEVSAGMLVVRSESDITVAIDRYRLRARFANMYIRHHVLQTLMYTACSPVDILPSARTTAFVADLVKRFGAMFPVTRNTSSALRSNFKILDTAMGEAIRMAVLAVSEWWVPPWTVAPQVIAGETCRDFLKRLAEARLVAFETLDLAELVVEVMAQTKLYIPSACVEMVAVHFCQSISGIFALIGKILTRAMAYCMRDTFGKLDTPDGPALVINHVDRICPDLFLVDGALVASGKDAWFHRADGTTIKLVEDVTATTLSLNGFFAHELLKKYQPQLFETVRDKFLTIFQEECLPMGRLMPITWRPAVCDPKDVLCKNFLTFWSTVVDRDCAAGLSPEVLITGDDYYISPHFMGIAADIALADDERRFDCQPYATLKYRGGTHRQQVDLSEEGRAAPPPSTLLQPLIHWFSKELLQRNIDGFKHSQCGIVPTGDNILYFAADGPRSYYTADCDVSWEQVEAHAIYAKYFSAGEYTLQKSLAELGRYMGFATEDPLGLAENDSYLTYLRESLPADVAEAALVENQRYQRYVGGDSGDSEEGICDDDASGNFAAPGTKLKRAASRMFNELSEESDHENVPLKKLLTSTAMQLLAQMHKHATTKE